MGRDPVVGLGVSFGGRGIIMVCHIIYILFYRFEKKNAYPSNRMFYNRSNYESLSKSMKKIDVILNLKGKLAITLCHIFFYLSVCFSVTHNFRFVGTVQKC